MLELSGIFKSFHDGESELQVLHGVDLALEGGDSIALLGASGSGKSTLLQIAAGLETPDQGEVRVLGEPLQSLGERQLALLRRRHLGFVFQQFNLLPGLKVLDNVLFQRRLNGLPDEDEWTAELHTVLELGPLLHRPVEVLSGGQQQRVAIARALAHRPELVFADEPTGNLHDTLSRQIMELLARLVDESGCSLLLVTHSRRTAAFARRRLLLKAGTLHAQE
jgi:putative ABC transport system ATP-binding protein